MMDHFNSNNGEILDVVKVCVWVCKENFLIEKLIPFDATPSLDSFGVSKNHSPIVLSVTIVKCYCIY